MTMKIRQRIEDRAEARTQWAEHFIGQTDSGRFIELKPSRDVIEDIDMHNLVWRQEAIE